MGKLKPNAPLARQRCSEDEFKDQCFVVKDGFLCCSLCLDGNEPRKVPLKREKLRRHCFGETHSRTGRRRNDFESLDRDAKIKVKHFKKLSAKLDREKKGQLLTKAVNLQRDRMFQLARESSGVKKVKIAPSTLSDETIARRVHVLRVHYQAGIPLSKLDEADYYTEWESNGPPLGGRSGVRSAKGILHGILLQEIKAMEYQPGTSYATGKNCVAQTSLLSAILE